MSQSNSKRNKAVALKYRPEKDNAPVVIASGYGQIADKIIGVAEEKGIPVFKDDSAASMLCMLEVGRSIPPELYEVIAAIYMQIINISEKVKHQSDPSLPLGSHKEEHEDLLRQVLSKTKSVDLD